jgi:hypothetical protein
LLTREIAPGIKQGFSNPAVRCFNLEELSTILAYKQGNHYRPACAVDNSDIMSCKAEDLAQRFAVTQIHIENLGYEEVLLAVAITGEALDAPPGHSLLDANEHPHKPAV